MSIPYESSSFAITRTGAQSTIEYPFVEEGDNTTALYRIHCVVSKNNYSPIALDTTMGTATLAGVTELPFGSDPLAYHLGDRDFRIRDGVLLEFYREFANIPQTTTLRPNGTMAYTYPGIYVSGGTFQASKTVPIGTFVNSDYFLPGVSPGITTATDITLTPTFRPVFLGNGMATNLLLETLTRPTAAEYEALIAAKAGLAITSTVDRWRGNIYVRSNVFVIAQ